MLTKVLEFASYHAVYEDSILDALRLAGGAGFSGIQVAVESPHLAFDAIPPDECRRIAEHCRQQGMRVALHAPDTAVSLLETNRCLRQGTFAYFASLFEFAERISCRLITIHAGKISTFGTDTEPRRLIPEQDLPLYRRAFHENLGRLIDMASGRFMICIENYLMDDMVQEAVQPCLDAGRLFLCWDLAKTYRNGVRDEDQEEFLWRNVSRIRQVHLHDFAGNRSHMAVGTGQLDFMRYLPRLAAANVQDFCHEVRPRQRAIESLANLKALIRTHRSASNG